jgi:hypothetical protein
MSAKRYWIRAMPQQKQAYVFWLDHGLAPVDTQPRHIMSNHGPYTSAEKANAAMRVLFGCGGYVLRPIEKDAGHAAA